MQCSGFAGDNAFRAMFPFVDDRPVSGISVGVDQKDRYADVEVALVVDNNSGMFLAGLAGD